MDQTQQEANLSQQPFIAPNQPGTSKLPLKFLYVIPLIIGLLLFGVLGFLIINDQKQSLKTVKIPNAPAVNQPSMVSPSPAFDIAMQASTPVVQVVSPTATPSPATSGATLLTDLVSFWKIDESTSSSTMKDSHGVNHGNPTGTAIIWGLLGKARSFNGQNDVVTIPTNINLNPIDKSFSWSSWFQIDTLYSTASAFLAKNDYQSFEGFVMQYSGNGAVKALLFQPTFQLNVESPLSTVTTKVWNHVVSTWDSSLKTLTLFVNGSLVASATSSAAVNLNPSSDLVLGKGTVGVKSATGSATAVTTSFRGNIDEVGFWTRSLSSAEVAFLYNSSKGTSFDAFATSSAIPTPTVATSSAVQGTAIERPSWWEQVLHFFKVW